MKAPDYSELLDKPAYMMVLLAIIAGWDYPSAIAKLLKKSQPTVSLQLSDLVAAGLVKPGERGKAQRYVVVWNPIIKELHHVMETGLFIRGSLRGNRFLNQVAKVGFDRIVPRESFQVFLRRYFLELRQTSGIQKTFSEICFSMFQSIDKLSPEERDNLARRFGVDSAFLRDVASLIGMENYHVELLALQDLAEEHESGEDKE